MSRLVPLAVAVALIALPLLLRRTPPATAAGERLVIISPHDENTRSEFARAFQRWALVERGVLVEIDWRTPGGTADIQRFLRARYRAALGDALPELADADRFDAPGEPAHAAFLASEVGIGHDIYWGGGEAAFRRCADQGFLVDAGLARAHPAWFADAVIPQRLGGEAFYDERGRWYGASLGSLGIAANRDRLAALADPTAPDSWMDLGEPRLAGLVSITDPTRSSAAVNAFERLIQQQMHLADAGDEARARAIGWERGFALIRRIVGNARSVDDAVSKGPRAVARGEAVAAICLDFQAHGEAAYAEAMAGERRLTFTAPLGGASVGADPIALLRGAPSRALATDFIGFVLSPEGQRLWSYRVGAPGGPTVYALHRAPVRRDVYTAADRALMSEPTLDPFALAAASSYRAERTAAIAGLIAPLTRALALDARPELTAAWEAIIAAGGPERVPEAMAAFAWMPVAYADADESLALIRRGPREALPLMRGWTSMAIARYADAERLARAGR
ncbi:MAG TPA: extracellular solute-binding protein [Planctomycetota bacterium]|nr:extracellular solute-binding protein [Planctomycetota bacterium]